MVKNDAIDLYGGFAYCALLAILLVSVPVSLIALWRASSLRASPGRRWEILAKARWVGSNAAVSALLTPEGQERLHRAIVWQRVSVVGIGLIVLTTLAGALFGS